METEIKKRFFEGVDFAKNNIVNEDNGPMVGFEMEHSLVDDNLKPAKPEIVEKIIAEKPEVRKLELGSFQIELAMNRPVNGSSIEKLVKILKGNERELVESCRRDGLNVLRIGVLPNLNPKDIVVANAERYKTVPKFHDERRKKDAVINGIDFGYAKTVGMSNAVQINVQAKSLEDGIDKVNRSLMVGPYVAAICGNARIVDSKDTGFNDVRMEAWEASHDLREKGDESELRVGLPNSYFSGIDDYFERISRDPFIFDLKDAEPLKVLNVGIGLCWKDTRLKIIKGDDQKLRPVVEFRLVSTQPSVEEDVAAMMFYLGRVQWSQMTDEELLPIGKTRLNRNEAHKYGLDGMMYGNDGRLCTDVRRLLGIEFDRAEEGLTYLGFDRAEAKESLGLLRCRKETPSTEFVLKVEKEGLEEAIKAYLVK